MTQFIIYNLSNSLDSVDSSSSCRVILIKIQYPLKITGKYNHLHCTQLSFKIFLRCCERLFLSQSRFNFLNDLRQRNEAVAVKYRRLVQRSDSSFRVENHRSSLENTPGDDELPAASRHTVLLGAQTTPLQPRRTFSYKLCYV